MSLRIHLTTGTLLLLVGLTMMAYTVNRIGDTPVVCVPVLAWLAWVEYAVARAWWPDAQEAYAAWRTRTQ